MIKTIYPGSVKGSVPASPSKSLMQRAVAAALLSRGTTLLKNPSSCDDSKAALKIVQRLGATVSQNDNGISITGSDIVSEEQILNCGESGLALRMFAPLSTLFAGKVTFTGEETLLKRPVTMITDALQLMGVETESNNGLLPLMLKGHMKGGKYRINCSSGSQLLTGLLMTMPLLDTDSELIVESLKSKPYIDMTLKLLDDFGIKIQNNNYTSFLIPGKQKYSSREYVIEGDWSCSAFLLVAGAVAGSIEISNLSLESKQADKDIIDVLKSSGAHVSVNDDIVSVSHADLLPFYYDAIESPDLFPPLAALASFCNGTSRIRGVSRLAHKESNRTFTIMQVLEKLGIMSTVQDDDMIITGSAAHGGAVSSYHDHRIAMMASVIALKSKSNVIISEAEAVGKSYPDFYNILRQLGVFMR